MTDVAACRKSYSAEKGQHYSWLEDYLERLESKETHAKFQDHRYEDSDYYVLVASLAA
jgi:hypothetical protein